MKGFTFVPAKKETIDEAFNKALYAAKEQIITDCNFYVRVFTGTMKATSQTESIVRDNTLSVIWDTPYAKRVYYTGTPQTDYNANASLMWAEKAAKRWKHEWEAILQKGLKTELK
jgi:hypothetical protein